MLDTTEGVAEMYIYDEIGMWGISANDVAKALVGLEASTLNVYINSPGGDVYDGIAIYNNLKRCSARVNVTVDGLAASSASFIAMAGDTINIYRNAEMMIHDAWGVCMGPASEMRRMADDLDRCSDNIADVYASRAKDSGGDTGAKKKKAWRNLMLAETWFTAEEAVAAGLADEVIDPSSGAENVTILNSWDLSPFRFAGRVSAPDPVLAKTTETTDGIPEYDPSSLRDALQRNGRL
jgi:ATP-dependent protease ClpP protease subunit